MIIVYFIYDLSKIKIGYSKNPKQRLKCLKTAISNGKLILLGTIHSDMNLEKELHRKFDYIRVPNTREWFQVHPDLIDYINKNNCLMNHLELSQDDKGNNKIQVYKKMIK